MVEQAARRAFQAQLAISTGAHQDDQEQVGHHILTGRTRIQVGPQQIEAAIFNEQLIQERAILEKKVHTLQNALQNSKLENAELYSEFGQLAKQWAETVRELTEIHKQEKEKLEKMNDQLRKENNKMKKIIEDLEKMLEESEKEKRKLKVGQIGFLLEILVSQFIFPGDDKDSKRARYGFTLKSAEGKIRNLKNKKLQELAQSKFKLLEGVMFEKWFVDMVKDIKERRIGNAHPILDSYEDMEKLVGEEFKDDKDTCDDMLHVLEQLKNMYDKLQKPFGEQ